MRIDYYTDSTGFQWACIHLTNGKYHHYFLGMTDIEYRREFMYQRAWVIDMDSGNPFFT